MTDVKKFSWKHIFRNWFVTFQNLSSHYPKCSLDLGCNQCGLEFGRKEDLTRHLKRHVRDLTRFCDICFESFKSDVKGRRASEKLFQHKKHCQNIQDSRIFCRQCSEAFTNKKKHKSHEAKCVVPKCQHCNFVFKNKAWLTRHQCLKAPNLG